MLLLHVSLLEVVVDLYQKVNKRKYVQKPKRQKQKDLNAYEFSMKGCTNKACVKFVF